MEITIDVLEKYLLDRYGGWANEQGLFLKLVEEIGEVAEVMNMRSGSKKAKEVDLQKELGTELADMIHYIVAIAAINNIDLSSIMLEKDKKASIKYRAPLNILRTESGEKIFRQMKQNSARVVYPTRRDFVKYHGKDSADSRREEFLEVPYNHSTNLETFISARNAES